MGSFLEINGISVPVLAQEFGVEAELVGDEARTISGQLVRDVVAWRDAWRGTLVHQSASDALAYRELVRGSGHRVSWDSHLYTSRGRPPTSTVGLSIQTVSPRVGSGHLQIAAAASPNSAAYAVSLGVRWTVAVWRRLGAGAWSSYVVTSSGKKWVDGARNDAASTPWLSVGGGTVSLLGDTASAVDYDEGVFLPFEVPVSWGDRYHALTSAGTPWGDLPVVRVSGDAVAAGLAPKSAIGDAGRVEVVAASLNGTWTQNLHSFEFALREFGG